LWIRVWGQREINIGDYCFEAEARAQALLHGIERAAHETGGDLTRKLLTLHPG
jgi:hypothetical protein